MMHEPIALCQKNSMHLLLLQTSIEKLDTKIKKFVDSNANIETNSEYKLTLLKRELISRVVNDIAIAILVYKSPNTVPYFVVCVMLKSSL